MTASTHFLKVTFTVSMQMPSDVMVPLVKWGAAGLHKLVLTPSEHNSRDVGGIGRAVCLVVGGHCAKGGFWLSRSRLHRAAIN